MWDRCFAIAVCSFASALLQAQSVPEFKLSEPTNATTTGVVVSGTSQEPKRDEQVRVQSSSASIASVDAPTTAQFVKLCTNTADPADCGKKIEAVQIKHASASFVAKRDGKLLAITIPGEPPYIFEDVESEAGPNVSFYAYSSGADSVVLYRARADKLDFLLLHRPTGNVTELPNEPKFNRDGRYFVTADFCKEECENRVTVWRIERRGALRERVFAPRNPWSDADASWGSNTRLVIDATENGRSVAINLDMNDLRWTVLAP
jgi:hypothetical protein